MLGRFVPQTPIQDRTFVECNRLTDPAFFGDAVNKGLAVSQGRDKRECLRNPVRREVGVGQTARYYQPHSRQPAQPLEPRAHSVCPSAATRS